MDYLNKKNASAASLITNNEVQLFAMENLDAIKYLMAAIERYKEGLNADDWECDLGNMVFGDRGQTIQNR